MGIEPQPVRVIHATFDHTASPEEHYRIAAIHYAAELASLRMSINADGDETYRIVQEIARLAS